MTELNLSRVNDPESVENAAVLTAAVSGLTLIEPRRLGTGGRVVYRSAVAVLTGWVAWSGLRGTPEYMLPCPAKWGYVAAASGLALGLAEADEKLDGVIHDALVRAGVKRPRRLMAAGAAVLSVGAWWFAKKLDDGTAEEYEEDEFEEPEYVDVPELVRALTSALLERTESFGAPELRAQLAHARAQLYIGEKEDEFYPGLGFEVPRELPRAVPGDANFPVIGRYRPIEGRTFDVRLYVQEGKLGTLDIQTGADWSEDENNAWYEADRSTQEITRWPRPDELEFLIETPAGLVPATS